MLYLGKDKKKVIWELFIRLSPLRLRQPVENANAVWFQSYVIQRTISFIKARPYLSHSEAEFFTQPFCVLLNTQYCIAWASNPEIGLPVRVSNLKITWTNLDQIWYYFFPPKIKIKPWIREIAYNESHL